jgi:hypothetical protein
MRFNVKKFKIMHIRTNNPCYEYTMNGQKFETSFEEKDVGMYSTSI